MEENKAKVLVGSPTYQGMRYCLDLFIGALKKIVYPHYDILLIDNSRGNDYFEELKKIEGIKVLKDETAEDKNILRLISSRNKLIQYALEKGYTHLLMMDSDVIPPPTIVSDLLACDQDIASGLYYNYFGVAGQVKYLPVAWKYFTDSEFEEIKKKYPLPPLVKSRLDLRRHLTREEAESNELMEVAIPSAGCMLIKRKVLEKIKYDRFNIPQLNVVTGDDIYFILKAREAGFSSYCYTKVRCEHLVKEKYKEDERGNLVHSSFV